LDITVQEIAKMSMLYQRERDLAKKLEERVQERTQELQHGLQVQEHRTLSRSIDHPKQALSMLYYRR
jgi:hypothetical protein